ncbi:GntR family transcriptional regulator [Paenirhodobacter sp.]|uniref:GntR family transcriptional regulator n=1 Tax=Paenirhodobacter sp. TaxID=1965326 RepID=UPI003B3D1C28
MTLTARASDRIRTEIEQRIAAGVYQNGEKLNEVALAEQFAASRTPLREALQTLAADGLVELIPNRGAFVRRPSVTRLVEMFEVMAELEAWCVRLATRRVTAAQRVLMGQASHDCAAALAANRPGLYYEANNRLHNLIYEASGNGFLAEETRRLQRRLRPFRRHQLDVSGRLEASMREHEAILAAMDAGDPVSAEKRMRDHIGAQNRSYDRFLETVQAPPG